MYVPGSTGRNEGVEAMTSKRNNSNCKNQAPIAESSPRLSVPIQNPAGPKPSPYSDRTPDRDRDRDRDRRPAAFWSAENDNARNQTKSAISTTVGSGRPARARTVQGRYR